MLKNEQGNIHSGWIGALATIAGAILHKNISLISNTFGYETWIPLFSIVMIGLYNEYISKKNGKANAKKPEDKLPGVIT